MKIPPQMIGVQLTGYGGLDKIEYRTDIPTPKPAAREVLVQVSAAGMNNTDINTRIGWYNQSVKSGTTTEGGVGGFEVEASGMGDWTGDIQFPRIQGADVVGTIVAVGEQVEIDRIGEKVVCNPYIADPDDSEGLDSAGFLGAEYDGGFAQFTAIPQQNAITLCDDMPYSDQQITTLPCSGGTAMNMLLMASVGPGDRMLVTGASGGVGSFLVQIGKHLGAQVIAVASSSKQQQVLEQGADAIVDRKSDSLKDAALKASGGESYSVVADVVGGNQFSDCLSLLKRGGRYVIAGAIAGPVVTLDLRTLYLKNLSFFGSTIYRQHTFGTLLSILRQGGVNPKVASARPLSEIRQAQTDFLKKRHVGSVVLIPPLVKY